MTLHYRGSRDGWMAKDFHTKCDNKGRTITLCQIKDGDCIGGFTNASWSTPNSEEKEFKGDIRAFLFNLNTQTTFP